MSLNHDDSVAAFKGILERVTCGCIGIRLPNQEGDVFLVLDPCSRDGEEDPAVPDCFVRRARKTYPDIDPTPEPVTIKEADRIFSDLRRSLGEAARFRRVQRDLGIDPLGGGPLYGVTGI